MTGGSGVGVGGSSNSNNWSRPSSTVLLSRHEYFYAVVQAVCYVLCFLGTEVASQHRMNEAIQNTWQRIVSSNLDPLRYCLRTVRLEFLRLAAFVGLFSDNCWASFAPDLAYIEKQEAMTRPTGGAASVVGSTTGGATTTTFSVTATFTTASAATSSSIGVPIATGSRLRSGTSALDTSMASIGAAYARMDRATGKNPLDSFFPFDPCLLEKMHRLIEGSYRAWTGVPGLPVADEGDESVSFVDDEEEEEEEEFFAADYAVCQADDLDEDDHDGTTGGSRSSGQSSLQSVIMQSLHRGGASSRGGIGGFDDSNAAAAADVGGDMGYKTRRRPRRSAAVRVPIQRDDHIGDEGGTGNGLAGSVVSSLAFTYGTEVEMLANDTEFELAMAQERMAGLSDTMSMAGHSLASSVDGDMGMAMAVGYGGLRESANFTGNSLMMARENGHNRGSYFNSGSFTTATTTNNHNNTLHAGQNDDNFLTLSSLQRGGNGSNAALSRLQGGELGGLGGPIRMSSGFGDRVLSMVAVGTSANEEEASAAEVENAGSPNSRRRPRQYSIGSTGSW